jgi:hypothetical protein
MQDDKEKLREALNLRIGARLAAEINRIAARNGKSASEMARTLLSYGVEVDRRLEAQRLMEHHEGELDDDVAGRIEVKAEFVPYTWQEVTEMREELEARGSIPSRHPTWDDVIP